MSDNDQQEKPKDFELIELLFKKKIPINSTVSIDPESKSQLEDFSTRFQSFIDQIPSYLHSIDKPGFFTHLFFGIFSTLLNTKINREKSLNVKRLYYHFEDAQTLKIIAISGRDPSNLNKIDQANIFIFSERDRGVFTNHASSFNQSEWDSIKSKINLPAQIEHITPKIKLIKITKDIKENGIEIEVEENKKIESSTASPGFEFKKIKEIKNSSGNPIYFEDCIENLDNPNGNIVEENFKNLLAYITKVHINHSNRPYGSGFNKNRLKIEFREANHHGFVTGVLLNFKYRYHGKIYLEQLSGPGFADIFVIFRGPNHGVNAVRIIIELKAKENSPTVGLNQARKYTTGPIRVLTISDQVLYVGLNLDFRDSATFDTKILTLEKPKMSLIEQIFTNISDWDGNQENKAILEEQIKEALSYEYDSFPGTKETKDHYYFSRYISGKSILLNSIDQDDVKKYLFSYDERPLEGYEGKYSLSESPVTTLVFIKGSNKKGKIAFIFHIRESNTKEFCPDKKIPIVNIPNVEEIIEIHLSLKKYETGMSFDDRFKVEKINKYNKNSVNQLSMFKGKFIEIPDSKQLKIAFDQTINSQRETEFTSNLLHSQYEKLFSEIAKILYPINESITNEARLQAFLNGLTNSYCDLKLQESYNSPDPSTKIVIIPEFQTGAGGRIDMLIQAIGPSDQGTKEYIPIGLEFKKHSIGLSKKQQRELGELEKTNLIISKGKEAVEKLTKAQKHRYAQGAGIKAMTDSDKAMIGGVLLNVNAENPDTLIFTSGSFTNAVVVHSSIDMIAKKKHMIGLENIKNKRKGMRIQGEDLNFLESATDNGDYNYWLQQHDIARIARIGYRDGNDVQFNPTNFEIIGSLDQLSIQLERLQNVQHIMTMIINLDNRGHWVTLVVYQNNAYYADSLYDSEKDTTEERHEMPNNIRSILDQAQTINNIFDLRVSQQTDGYNCGLWALENAITLNQTLQENQDLNGIKNRLKPTQQMNEKYFEEKREELSRRLFEDNERQNLFREIETVMEIVDIRNITQQTSGISDPLALTSSETQIPDQPLYRPDLPRSNL